MEKEVIIKVENLSKFFKSRNNYKIALDNISFEINKGDFLGVIGESGSGKTTLGKTIIRLENVSSGSIKLFGRNISNKKLDRDTNLSICKNMQMIFQDPLSSLNPKMNILKLISEPIIINKSIKKEVSHFLTSRYTLNFLFEYYLLIDLYKNKYIYLSKYYDSYNDLINKTLDNINKFKFSNLNSWTESFSQLETEYDFFIHSEKDVINIANKMYESNKKIIESFEDKIKNNEINDLHKDYLRILKIIEDSEITFKEKEKNIKDLKNKLNKIIDNIKFFKNNNLVKNELNDLNIHLKSNKNNMKISKTKKDYNYNYLLVLRDSSKLEILKKLDTYLYVNQEKILIEFFEIQKIVDKFFSDKSIKLFSNNLIEGNIDYKFIENEVEIILSKILDDIYKKLDIENKKNNIIINDLFLEKKKIIFDIKELKIKNKDMKEKFYNSEDFKNNSDLLSLLKKKIIDHKKGEKKEFLNFLNSEIKEKKIDLKIKIQNVKKNKLILMNNFKKLNKQLLDIRPSDLKKFKKIDAYSLIRTNNKSMKNQLKIKLSSLNLIDFELKKILEYYFIEEKICSSKKIKLNFYKNDILKLLILNKVFYLLESVGLKKEHAYRYPHEFSGGQRQRVVIARSLINDPEIIIADEAVSALDVSVQAQVINMMKELSEKRNVTFIFIAHDLSMVKYICNNVLIMHNGRIVEKGSVNKIFKNPIHPYTQSLLKAIPELSKMDMNLSIYGDNSNYDKNYSISNNPLFLKVENNHEVLATREQFDQWIQ